MSKKFSDLEIVCAKILRRTDEVSQKIRNDKGMGPTEQTSFYTGMRADLLASHAKVGSESLIRYLSWLFSSFVGDMSTADQERGHLNNWAYRTYGKVARKFYDDNRILITELFLELGCSERK